MRKVILFYLLALLPLAAAAQVGQYRSEFAVGVNGGYLMNQISFQPDVPQKMMGGLTGGITLRYTSERYFNSICAIVAEVNYAQMGWKEDIFDANNEPIYYRSDTEFLDPLYYERRINYIQVPVMARMGWGRERKGFQGFFQIGPQMGFYLDESTSTNTDSMQPTTAPRSSVVVAQEKMPVENKFDYGITGGAGIEFSHPKIGHILLEGRYYFGLGNIYGNSKQDYFGKSNNGTIIIKMTYLYDLHRSKNNNVR